MAMLSSKKSLVVVHRSGVGWTMRCPILWFMSVINTKMQLELATSQNVAINGVLLWNEMHEYKSFVEKGDFISMQCWCGRFVLSPPNDYYSHRSPTQLGPCQWLSLPVDTKQQKKWEQFVLSYPQRIPFLCLLHLIYKKITSPTSPTHS